MAGEDGSTRRIELFPHGRHYQELIRKVKVKRT
jgi:hypothetical protein